MSIRDAPQEKVGKAHKKTTNERGRPGNPDDETAWLTPIFKGFRKLNKIKYFSPSKPWFWWVFSWNLTDYYAYDAQADYNDLAQEFYNQYPNGLVVGYNTVGEEIIGFVD